MGASYQIRLFIYHIVFTSPPSPLLNKATVYTQVIKFSQVLTEKPPNPQFWGNKSSQSPPELGDLGG